MRTMKKCGVCKNLIEISLFHKDNRNKDGLQYKCKSCFKDYTDKNKDKRAKWLVKNKEYHKEWYLKNKERFKDWYKKNKNFQNEYNKKYQFERRKKDPLYKLTLNLRARTSLAFKNKGITKKIRTNDLLGIDFCIAKQHIESNFEKGMTWDNYGEWHIDHIFPLSLAKDKQHLIKLCHYKNLQPLWAEENFRKGNRLIEL